MITTPHARPLTHPMTQHLADAGIDLSKLRFYSTFDGGGRLEDDSGRGNHGAITGALWKGTGRYGQALWFDDTNDVIVASNENDFDIGATESFAVWHWVKMYALNLSFIFSKGGTGASSYNGSINGAGVYSFTIQDAVNPSVAGDGATTLTVGKWFQIMNVFNRNDNTLTVYMNGEQSGAIGDITGLGAISNAASFQIGNVAAAFGGSMDGMGLVKHAVDSETVKSLYRMGL